MYVKFLYCILNFRNILYTILGVIYSFIRKWTKFLVCGVESAM